VFGLRRALEIAGARTTIMSLWRVPDEETRRFMRLLYQARLAGLGTAAALRQAMLETLQAARAGSTTDGRYQRYRPDHPFLWGSFVAAGSWD
jgi:CHAT domain-containing protein